MRTVTGAQSAFYTALQAEKMELCELIEITTRTGTYRYTTANQALVSSGSIYDPFPGLNAQGVEESTDLGIGNIAFQMANSGTLPGELTNAQALEHASIAAYRVFTNSPDLGRLYYFDGNLADYIVNRAEIGGQIRNRLSGNQNWPYYSYQDNCAWRFGSTGCGINTSSFTTATSLIVSSSTRNIILATSGALINSFNLNALQMGRATITSGVNSGQARAIFANTGDQITLSHALPFSHDVAGVTFQFTRPCRKRFLTDCVSVFNNSSAHLGFQWIPKEAF
jgi:hypothetical protein